MDQKGYTFNITAQNKKSKGNMSAALGNKPGRRRDFAGGKEENMRRTKIICTLGPAVDDEKMIRKLIQNGMDCARFNFSHGTHEQQKERKERVQKVSGELGIPIAFLLDTKGPEIRLKDFEGGSAMLKAGQTFTLDTDKETPGDSTRIGLTYDKLAKSVSEGTRILIDDGKIALKVAQVKGTKVVCTVVNGGKISNHKSINVPNVVIPMPYLSPVDKEDILFGIEQKFDYIAASFVRSADDVRKLRKFLKDNGGGAMRIISKIENGEGVKNLDEILMESDGIMVARGDLGVEIPFKEIPAIQKVMINKCNEAGKIVVTATQMLESMTQNPRPTRAEVSDVANSIYDGTTAIMLSGESAAGAYPAESVKTMAEIAQSTEESIDYSRYFVRDHMKMEHTVANAVCASAYSAASYLEADAIVVVTRTGRTARMLSDFKPTAPVLAVTMEEEGIRGLKLAWGVKPVAADRMDTPEALFDYAVKKAQESGLVKKGSTLIVVTSSDLENNSVNDVMRICKI